ncbi:hypothetical protein BDV98DRAFT_210627 [Pterulicium gracile]|uniref:Uncharacterized protein n=1 Tax=Pterulicium gracile TaxID=1884261 RepID=A0A5C3Q9B9_9AGAR|nr:hypothetical protein BDV98DRAFT_210627 [Pterula gracilis]
MVKKQKQEAVPTAQPAPTRDIIQRLNFSYQASVFLANLAYSVPASSPSAALLPSSVAFSSSSAAFSTSSAMFPTSSAAFPLPPAASAPAISSGDPSQKRRRARQISLGDLSRKWASDVEAVGKKTTVRIDLFLQ